MMATAPRDAITALFVPGDRPDRFAKALGSGADVVIVDLEDAVAPHEKSAARAHVRSALVAGDSRIMVRINPPQTSWHDDDIALVADFGPDEGLLGVVVAKAESAAQLSAVQARIKPGVEIVALIESARGLAAVTEIASAGGVTRLAFGAIDLALDLDSTSEKLLDLARFELAVASRVADLAPPLDTPSVEIRDVDAVAESARHARGFGFGGKLCIHPAQLAPVRAAFLPTPSEVAWAQLVLTAGTESATQVGGIMVDRPVIERARRILATAAATEGAPA